LPLANQAVTGGWCFGAILSTSLYFPALPTQNALFCSLENVQTKIYKNALPKKCAFSLIDLGCKVTTFFDICKRESAIYGV
jgi:hypothetical protein